MLFLVVCASVKLTLTPGSLRVVGKLEDVLLGESGTSEQLKYRKMLSIRVPKWSRRPSLTAKLPGALRPMVHPHPLYRLAIPSSLISLTIPRPRKASGLVCILILSTSRGSRT
jgi:hypothetical protein